MPDPPGRVDPGRALLLVSCLLLVASLQASPEGAGAAAPATLILTVTAGGLVALLAVLAPGRVRLPLDWVRRIEVTAAVLLLAIGILTSAPVLGRAVAGVWLDSPGAARTALAAALAVLVLLLGGGVAVVAVRGTRGWPPLALAAGYALLLAAAVHARTARIDVMVFQHDAAAALLRGTDPYTITFADPYPPELSRLFYGPGVSEQGRLQFGYPYPPLSLLLTVPGYLLGDPRWAMCAAIVVSAGLLWWAARDRLGRACAGALAFLPGLPYVLVNGWTEPLSLALLTAVAVGATRRWRATPYLLGLLLVSKQYMVILLPALWLLVPLARRSTGGIVGFTARAVASAVLVTAPMALWHPGPFWESVVRLQFRQPFRDDSISLLVWSVHTTGWPPALLRGWLPLAAGLLVATLAAWRAPRTPAGFAASVGAALLITFLLSRQAFSNYYLLGVGALLVAAGLSQAAATVPPWNPDRARAPASRRRWTSSARR